MYSLIWVVCDAKYLWTSLLLTPHLISEQYCTSYFNSWRLSPHLILCSSAAQTISYTKCINFVHFAIQQFDVSPFKRCAKTRLSKIGNKEKRELQFGNSPSKKKVIRSTFCEPRQDPIIWSLSEFLWLEIFMQTDLSIFWDIVHPFHILYIITSLLNLIIE